MRDYNTLMSTKKINLKPNTTTSVKWLAITAFGLMVSALPYQGAQSQSTQSEPADVQSNNSYSTNIPVHISFHRVLTMNNVQAIKFGKLGIHEEHKSYTINPANHKVTSSNGGTVLEDSERTAGSFAITTNNGARLTVEAGDLSAATSGGVSLSDPVCSYNGAALACGNGSATAATVVDGQRSIAIGVTANVAANTSNTIEGAALQIPVTVSVE